MRNIKLNTLFLKSSTAYSMSAIVQVIPSILNVGKKEAVVVVFPVELPRGSLITLDITYSNRSSWSCWVPAQPLGPNCIHANFPELTHPGELDVFVKVQRETFSPVPKFRLRVQSPVEAIYRSLSLDQPHDTTALACIAAYLMQNTEKDRDTLSHIDITMCNILRNLPSLTEWNVANVICGKYGQQETLLHMCIRHRLGGAASQLLQSTRGKGALLQQHDHNGKTAAQIARKKGEKRIAEIVQKAIAENEEIQAGAGGSLARKASKSSNYSHVHNLQASGDVGPLPLQIKGAKNLKHMLIKLKSKAKASKGVGDKKPPTNDNPPLIPHSQVATEQHAAVLDPAIVEEFDSTTEPLDQLLSRTMYKASVTCDYHWHNSPFRDQFSLEKGDIVYVIKEIGEDLCQGVCRNYYCMIPKHILCVETNGEIEEYEEMSAEDEYDTVDAFYEHPAVEQTGYDLQINFPPALPPREAPDIKSVSVKYPIMRGPLKTQHAHPIPGRLLSCSHSSSHDTGLDRLGMPRQVSKSKLQGLNAPEGTTGFTTRKATASRVPYEYRTLKPTQNTAVIHSPGEKLSPLPTEPLEEYDDAMTIKQIALQKQQQVHDKQVSSVSPQVKRRHQQTSHFDTSSNEKPPPMPKPRTFISPSKFQRPTVTPGKDPERLETETPSKTKATNVLELTKQFERK